MTATATTTRRRTKILEAITIEATKPVCLWHSWRGLSEQRWNAMCGSWALAGNNACD